MQPNASARTSSSVGEIVSLPDQDMLRGVRLADVLHRSGALLADSGGSAQTYSLSEPVKQLDAFISHNWATSRSLKFVALALHFNSSFASLAGAACVVATTALAAAGAGPVLVGNIATAVLALPCTFPVFWTMLLLKHELAALVGLKGPHVFLDKVCIDQRSDDAKQHGIRGLAAFLSSSSCLVVCYTDLYLQKLWTVYELATFLQVHGGDARRRVHVVPTGLSCMMAVCCAVVMANVCVVRVLQVRQVTYAPAISNTFVALAALASTVPLRKWARQQRQAHASFARFSIENALCTKEEDRALVKANSITLMKFYGFAEKDASMEEALAAFDDLVRTAVPDAFASSLGRLGFPYRQVFPLALTFFSSYADLWAGSTRVLSWEPQEVFLILLCFATSCFGVLPLAIAAILALSRYCLELRGPKEVAYRVLVAAVGGGTFGVCDPWRGPMSFLLMKSRTSRGAQAGVVLWCGALMAATAVVYWPVRASPLKRCQRPSPFSPRSSVTQQAEPSGDARAYSRAIEGPGIVTLDVEAPCGAVRLAGAIN